MVNRDYKLYTTIQFLLNRKNYLITATSKLDKELLQKNYNTLLLELKEILKIKDTMEIIDVKQDRVVIPSKYYKQSIELFKKCKIRGYKSKMYGIVTENTTIFVK